MSAPEHRAERSRCIETLRQRLQASQSGVWTRTEVGRGETDSAARACGDFATLKRGWPFGGGQYHKGLAAADAVYRALGLPLDQETGWHEIH